MSKHEDIVHEEVVMPFPLANREYLKWRYFVCNKENPDLVRKYGLYDLSSRYYAVTMKSVSLKDIPPAESIVRGEVRKSYWFLREDPTDRNSCKIKVVISQDLKGMVPGFILNRIASKYPRKIVNKFLDNYKKIFY